MSIGDSQVRLVATPGGRVYVSENDQGTVARALLTKQEYERDWTRWMQANIGVGSRALDIGANVGYYTALLASLVGPQGSVTACEPDPVNAALLRRTIAENGFTQVHVIQAAVADHVGRQTLYQDEAWHGVHSLAAENIVNPGDRRAEVETVTIDSLSAEHAIRFRKNRRARGRGADPAIGDEAARAAACDGPDRGLATRAWRLREHDRRRHRAVSPARLPELHAGPGTRARSAPAESHRQTGIEDGYSGRRSTWSGASSRRPGVLGKGHVTMGASGVPRRSGGGGWFNVQMT